MGVGMIIWPILLVGLILIALRLANISFWRSPPEASKGRPQEESALEILRRRYAKGEISREDFERMRGDIRSA